jgi:hypothetical protein
MALGKLNRIWQHYRREGALGLLRLASVSDTPVPKLAFLATYCILRLDSFNRQTLARALVGYELEAGQAAALEEIVGCLPPGERSRTRLLFAAFFRQGSRCAVIRHRGQVIGYNWAFARRYVATYDGYRRKNVDLELGEGVVCFGNGYIAEAHRLKGLFPHLLRFSMSLHETATDFYSTVSVLNANSLASHLRLGFSEVGRLTCVSVLHQPLFFYRGRDGRWRRLAGARPRLRIETGSVRPSHTCSARPRAEA